AHRHRPGAVRHHLRGQLQRPDDRRAQREGTGPMSPIRIRTKERPVSTDDRPQDPSASSASGRATVGTGPGQPVAAGPDTTGPDATEPAAVAPAPDGPGGSGGRRAARGSAVRGEVSLRAPKLPRWAPLLTALVATAAGALLALTLGWGLIAFAVVSAAVYAVALPAWALVVENRRSAVDRLEIGRASGRGGGQIW